MYERRLKERSDSVDTLDGVNMEVEVSTSYDIKDKVTSAKFTGDFLLDLDELSFQRVQEFGFKEPIRVKQKSGLGMYSNHLSK